MIPCLSREGEASEWVGTRKLVDEIGLIFRQQVIWDRDAIANPLMWIWNWLLLFVLGAKLGNNQVCCIEDCSDAKSRPTTISFFDEVLSDISWHLATLDNHNMQQLLDNYTRWM
ncbi:hypothetical protein AKJ16_DCAP15211, partial [Drosera capensis]